jgi:nitrate reductase NapE component
MAQPGRNKLLLERLPIWATFMLFLAFIVMILATVTLVGIYGPALYQTYCTTYFSNHVDQQ